MQNRESFWTRCVRRSVGATSEVYFPENDFGAPDWRSTEMVERTMQYLEELPPQARRLLYFLFLSIEWLAPFLLAGLGRFSNRSLAFRQRAIRRWNTSEFFLFRTISEGLKAQLTMTYLSHVDSQKHLGVWKACAREADPYGTPVRPEVLEDYTNRLKEIEG